MADPPPSWLTEDVPATSSITLDDTTEQQSLNQPTANPFSQAESAAESNDFNAGAKMLASSGHAAPPKPIVSDKDKSLPRIVIIMRVLNMVAAILLLTVSIIMMVGVPNNFSMWVLAIYASCGGLLVCLHETQLKYIRTGISNNFGFLYSSIWRMIFYIMLGSISYQYKILFGYIVAGLFVGIGLFNTYVLCRYPAYAAIREKIAKEADEKSGS